MSYNGYYNFAPNIPEGIPMNNSHHDYYYKPSDPYNYEQGTYPPSNSFVPPNYTAPPSSYPAQNSYSNGEYDQNKNSQYRETGNRPDEDTSKKQALQEDSDGKAKGSMADLVDSNKDEILANQQSRFKIISEAKLHRVEIIFEILKISFDRTGRQIARQASELKVNINDIYQQAQKALETYHGEKLIFDPVIEFVVGTQFSVISRAYFEYYLAMIKATTEEMLIVFGSKVAPRELITEVQDRFERNKAIHKELLNKTLDTVHQYVRLSPISEKNKAPVINFLMQYIQAYLKESDSALHDVNSQIIKTINDQHLIEKETQDYIRIVTENASEAIADRVLFESVASKSIAKQDKTNSKEKDSTDTSNSQPDTPFNSTQSDLTPPCEPPTTQPNKGSVDAPGTADLVKTSVTSVEAPETADSGDAPETTDLVNPPATTDLVNTSTNTELVNTSETSDSVDAPSTHNQLKKYSDTNYPPDIHQKLSEILESDKKIQLKSDSPVPYLDQPCPVEYPKVDDDTELLLCPQETREHILRVQRSLESRFINMDHWGVILFKSLNDSVKSMFPFKYGCDWNYIVAYLLSSMDYQLARNDELARVRSFTPKLGESFKSLLLRTHPYINECQYHEPQLIFAELKSIVIDIIKHTRHHFLLDIVSSANSIMAFKRLALDARFSYYSIPTLPERHFSNRFGKSSSHLSNTYRCPECPCSSCKRNDMNSTKKEKQKKNRNHDSGLIDRFERLHTHDSEPETPDTESFNEC